MEIVTVTAAIAGLKNVIDLAKTAIAARDELKLAAMQQSINDRVIDVQNAALALQEKQSAARDEIDRLSEELRLARASVQQLEQTVSDRAKYVLSPISREGFAYKAEASGREPEHFICQPCFDGPEKRKVVLRTNPGSGSGVMRTPQFWSCPNCKYTISDR